MNAKIWDMQNLGDDLDIEHKILVLPNRTVDMVWATFNCPYSWSFMGQPLKGS